MISTVILAAGASRRMGEPKLNLPWGNTTVLGQVISKFIQAGVEDIVIAAGDVPITGLSESLKVAVRFVGVPNNHQAGMLLSLQTGLAELKPDSRAAFIALGDQPQIEADVIQAMLREYAQNHSPILIPSINLRRGHPWLLDHSLWPELVALDTSKTLRHFLNQHEHLIRYLVVQTESILQDLDTPSDYARSRPK
jgi:molybdenum cofactor cytidylyltransferase